MKSTLSKTKSVVRAGILLTANVCNDLTTINGADKLTAVTVGDVTPGDQRCYRLERIPAP